MRPGTKLEPQSYGRCTRTIKGKRWRATAVRSARNAPALLNLSHMRLGLTCLVAINRATTGLGELVAERLGIFAHGPFLQTRDGASWRSREASSSRAATAGTTQPGRSHPPVPSGTSQRPAKNLLSHRGKIELSTDRQKQDVLISRQPNRSSAGCRRAPTLGASSPVWSAGRVPLVRGRRFRKQMSKITGGMSEI